MTPGQSAQEAERTRSLWILLANYNRTQSDFTPSLYLRAGRIKSFQRQVRLICTFAFSHTAPSGNYKKSSWLQCMCENGFAVFDFSPFLHFFHSLSLPVSVLALWSDLWFCIWDIFLMLICRQIKSSPFFQQDPFQNSWKVFYQVQFVPVLHSESFRVYFCCRFLFPLKCQRLIAFKNVLAWWDHAAQIRACFLPWCYT